MNAALVTAWAALMLQAAGAAQVRETALARLAKAQLLAADPVVTRAVALSNAMGQSLAEIQRRDEAWVRDRAYPLRRQVVGAPCSERLRTLVADDPVIVEAFVMDAKGALACATRETSDYWQGDEPKWTKTVQEGRPVLLEEPALDMSTGTYAVQLSVPVSEGVRRVGAVTLTLKIRRGQAR